MCAFPLVSGWGVGRKRQKEIFSGECLEQKGSQSSFCGLSLFLQIGWWSVLPCGNMSKCQSFVGSVFWFLRGTFSSNPGWEISISSLPHSPILGSLPEENQSTSSSFWDSLSGGQPSWQVGGWEIKDSIRWFKPSHLQRGPCNRHEPRAP